MQYYLILGLQAYCFYHCYTNRNHMYWYFAILFIPIIGGLAYLFINVVQKQDIDRVQDELVTLVNPTKKITDLEKKFAFSATFDNQTKLADAYLEAKMYDKAIENYQAALKGTFENDFFVLAKLLETNYFKEDFTEAIAIRKRIGQDSKFSKSRGEFLYALALEKTDAITEAQNILEKFDAPYSRYWERLELAKFYIRNAQLKKAKTLLTEVTKEAEGMSKTSFRANRVFIKQSNELLGSLK